MTQGFDTTAIHAGTEPDPATGAPNGSPGRRMTVKTFRAILAARESSSIAVPLVRRSTIPCVEMRSPSSPTEAADSRRLISIRHSAARAGSAKRMPSTLAAWVSALRRSDPISI